MASSLRQSSQSDESSEPAGQGGGSFRLKTLGDASLLRVLPGGDVVRVLGPGKPLALVAYLTCSAGRSAGREHLIDLLWANLDLDGARQGLRQTLWYLRRRLGPDAMVTRDQEVALTACVDSDRDRFLEAIDRRDCERAIELYAGEFLPMFAAPGGADFEAWGDMERFRLRTYFLGAAEAVAWKRIEEGNLEGAKAAAQRARDIHPLAQAAWRLLLEILLAANDPLTARIEGEALARQLEAEKRIPDEATQRVLDVVRDSCGHTPDGMGDSVVRPEFTGRERDLAQILAAWRLARAGRGRHIHVRGSAGLGKTRLVKEVTSRLSSMGAQVVQIRAVPGRGEISYALASEMAGELAKLPGAEGISQGAAAVLTALNPGLTDRLSTPPIAARGDEIPRQRDLAMAELVAAATLNHPLALFVEDVHWADERSLELLHALSERVPNHRLLLVTTARPTGREASKACTEWLCLEPLSTDNVTTLLASLGTLPEGERAEDFPRRLWEAAGGSPLLILETLRLALERGLLALEDGRWVCTDHDSLNAELARGGALRWRVEGLPEEERQLLLSLCIAGAPMNLPTLARVVQRGPDEIAHELQVMEVGGLVRVEGNAWVPAHDKIGTAVLDGAEPGELALAHRRMGRVLAEEAQEIEGGPEPNLLLRSCRHLLAAGEWPEFGRICDSWVRTARRSGDRRTLRALAREVLGEDTDPAAVRRVTRTLPLSTRLGAPATGPRRLGLAGGAVAVMFWGLSQMGTPASAPPDAILMVLRPAPGGEVSGYELPIRRQGWEELETLDVRVDGRSVPELSGLPIHSGHVLQMPGQRRWAYAGVVEEAWGPDLFLLGPSGATERVTRTPGDDVPMSWAPDGRSLLIQTGRWNQNFWQDLAILDLETAEVRPLVRSDDSHSAASWSPDGTRVIFNRYRVVAERGEAGSAGDNPGEMCWIGIDAEGERCPDLPLEGIRPVGWVDPERVLVRAVDEKGTSGLYMVRLENAEVSLLHRGVVQAQASPDGRWLAILRGTPGSDAPQWFVHPMGHPELAVPLAGVDGLPAWAVRWGDVRHVARHLDHLEVLCPDSVQVGVPIRLRARGLDPQGRPLPLHALSWQMGDSGVATLYGDTDVLLPRAPGVAEVRVSAGGWREAACRVTVEPSPHRMLWTEDWGMGLEERWVPFGNPRPSVTEWPAGGWAFWNRGDGFYGSGAYSRQEMCWSRSPGLEAEVSIPRTGLRAQRVSLGFRTWIEPEAVEAWDHRTGNLVGADVRCEFTYPAGDGADQVAWAWTLGQRVPMDPTLASGEPHTVRIQVFPDGTCGLAVNGRPLFRGNLMSREKTSDRVILMGESLHTRVLVGRVEVWEGVRDGVDWAGLAWDAASSHWATPGRHD